MDITTPRLIGFLCGLMLVILFLQALFPRSAPAAPPATEPVTDCIGDPITVEYAFTGWNEPHACKVQCEDDQPRYILYTDGKATQCETPPGCNDTGEDKGILCIPPLQSPEN